MIITMEIVLRRRFEVANDTKWLDPDLDVEQVTPKKFWVETATKDIRWPIDQEIVVEEIKVVNVTLF